MRILRGQSNREVSSKGFALFVLGLILATFFGGAVRTMLGSERVHERIVSELKSKFPKQDLQIGRIEVLLSRGLWPTLGLRVHDLTFKQSVCGKLSFVLTLPEAELPLDLWALRRGVYRLSNVHVNGGELHLDYHACPPVASEEPKIAHASMPPVHSSVLAPKLNWQEAAKFVDGADLQNFIVSYEKSPTWKLVLNRATLRLSQNIALDATIEVEKSLPFGKLSHPITFNLKGDPAELNWSVKTVYNEGTVRIDGKNENGAESHIETTLRQVPIKELMNELNQAGLIDRDLKLKATWISCKLDWNGHLEKYVEQPMNVFSCGVEGGYGRAVIEPAKFWLDGSGFREPAKIHISELRVQAFLEALNRQVLPAVLTQPGSWSGELSLRSARDFDVDGELRGLEVAFSSASGHGKQVIESVHTQVGMHNHQVQASIGKIQMKDGVFDGGANFDLNDDWRDGTFTVALRDFQLSPAIQKLMLGGRLGRTHGDGKGTLIGGELKVWTGILEVDDLDGEGWKAQKLKLTSKFHLGVFHLDGLVASASVDSTWRLYPQLRRADSTLGDASDFRALEANVDIDYSGGRIHSLSARQTTPARSWMVKGNWIRDGEFEGKLTLVNARTKKSFDLRGDKGRMVVETPSEGSAQ